MTVSHIEGTACSSAPAPRVWRPIVREEDEGIPMEEFKKEVLPTKSFLTWREYGQQKIGALASAVGGMFSPSEPTADTASPHSPATTPNGTKIGNLLNSISAVFTSKRSRDLDEEEPNWDEEDEEEGRNSENMGGNGPGSMKKFRRVGGEYVESKRG